MKRFLSLKFLLGLALGAAVFSFLLGALNDEEPDTNYGEPDGDVSDGDVSSFVD